MTILVVLCSVLLILDCFILALLIIIQLPKKEAGVGLAFGGGATDALFGAGSGTALSNFTKYTTAAFFILVFSLTVLKNHTKDSGVSDLKHQLERQSTMMPATQPPPTPAANPSGSTAPAIPLTVSTNTISTTTTPASNTPAAPAK